MSGLPRSERAAPRIAKGSIVAVCGGSGHYAPEAVAPGVHYPPGRRSPGHYRLPGQDILDLQRFGQSIVGFGKSVAGAHDAGGRGILTRVERAECGGLDRVRGGLEQGAGGAAAEGHRSNR